MKLNLCTFASALLAAAAATTQAPSAALAQDAPQEEGAVELTAAPHRSPVARRSGPVGPLRFFGGFRVGVGGQFVDKEDNFGGDADADPTVGIQAGVDYVVMDYFAIGGETRLNWVKVDGADDRTMLWDLVVKPRGRYQLTNLPLELYGATPFGLSIANFDNDLNINGKAGATFGLLGGANYFFNDHMGVNAEIGAMFHWIHGESETPFGDVDVKFRLAQMALLQINFVYAL